jgi:hypothetical protein
MASNTSRVVVVLGLAALLGGCSGSLQKGIQDRPPEYVGYLSPEGFLPCDASPAQTRWRPLYWGPAARQEEHLRSSGLLSLARPLLVRVSGRVSEHQPGSLSGGFTHTISVTDILGMWLSGDCENPGRNFRPIT